MRPLLMLFAVLLAPSAAADGIKFTPRPVPSPMPAQCAVLSWRDGVERLAIRTEVDSGAGPSAWVVPVPAVPELFEVQPGVVESARAGFAPAFEAGPGDLLLFAVASAILVAFTQIAVAARGPLVTRIVVLIVVTLLWGAVVVVGGGRSRGFKAVGGGSEGAAVTLLDRRIVGAHEVAVISSADPGALAEWLTKFGLAAPAAAEAPIAAYCREGWCFVAARLHDAEAGLHAPAPVGMRFKAAAPVYPMRLTAAGNGSSPLNLELLVYGPGVARAPGMRVESSGRVELASELSRQPWAPSNSIRVSHEGVKTLIGDGAWATQLAGTLLPAAMANDISLKFDAPEEIGRRAMSSTGFAMSYAAGFGFAAAAVGVLTIPLAARRTWTWRRGGAALAAMVAFGAAGALQPTRGVRMIEVSSVSTFGLSRSFETAWTEVLMASLPPKSAQQARGMFETAWAKETPEIPVPTFGHGPGQFMIREVGDAAGREIECSWVNWFGQRTVEMGTIRLGDR